MEFDISRVEIIIFDGNHRFDVRYKISNVQYETIGTYEHLTLSQLFDEIYKWKDTETRFAT